MKIKQLSDLIPLLEQQKSNKDIAKRYNVSVPTVARWIRTLKDNNVPVPKRTRGARKLKI